MFGTKKKIYQATAETRVKLILDLTLNLNKNSKSLCAVTMSLVLDLNGKVQPF